MSYFYLLCQKNDVRTYYMLRFSLFTIITYCIYKIENINVIKSTSAESGFYITLEYGSLKRTSTIRRTYARRSIISISRTT